MKLSRALAGVILTAALVSGCTPTVRPRLPEPGDYAFPSARPGEVGAEEAQSIEKAWRAVLAGDPAGERAFLRILEHHPGLVPAETGLAFARLRAGRTQEADTGFESVLSRRPDYVPALVGAAAAARRRGDPDAALLFYRRGVAADPKDLALRKRLAEVKLQVTERAVTAARALLQAGDGERAIEQYRLALDAAPEVAGLRIELAELMAGRGDQAGAVTVLAADPGEDRIVLARLGDLLAEMGDHRRALDAYRRILARDPRDAGAQRRASEIRQTLELLQMPEEYRRIPGAPRITRADLAALVAVKVTALAKVPPGEARVAVDISGSWAREHIIRALSLDILDVYPNHTFQPGAMVRRADLARAVGRVLDLLKYPAAAAPELTDMSRANLYHDAATRVVAAGLMETTGSGAFEAWRPVSGQDAMTVLEGLVRLVGP